MWTQALSASRRIISLALGLAIIWLGVEVTLIHLNISTPIVIGVTGVEFVMAWTPNVLSAIGVTLSSLFIGALFAWLGLSGLTRPQKHFRLRIHGDKIARARGEVVVAEGGLLKLLAYAAEDIDGVSGAEPSLKLGNKGWEIRCVISVWHDKSLTEIVEALRRDLRHALERHTGTQVERIDVIVQHHPIESGARVN